jgi:multiple sugar transport system permease protein
MSGLGELRTLVRTRGSQRLGRKSKNEWSGYLFLTPWLVGILGITIIPMFVSLWLSFTDYRLTRRRGPRFIGWDNYDRMFHDPDWQASVWVTVKYVVLGVPLQLAVALGLAVLLDRGMRGLAFYRSVFYLPSLLGGSVAIAILWRQVFGADGLMNSFLNAHVHLGGSTVPSLAEIFHIHTKGWISSPDTALWTLILLHVWTFGSPMIIFLAGLRQIPRMYYEAAEVDGAGWWRRFRSITLPMLSPIIFFNLVLQVIGAFQSFTQAYVVSGGDGGPINSTLFYTLNLYKWGFGEFQMGYASAMAWFLLVAIALVTGVFFATSRFWVFYED